MTFEQFDAIFEAAYEAKRDATGENAPDSNLFFARTLDELRSEVDSIFATDRLGDAVRGGAQLQAIGDATTGKEVAWVYDIQLDKVIAIMDNARATDAEDVIRAMMNLDD